MSKLTAISLFSGAGGMDVGVNSAGFEVVYANEINKHAVETYKANFGGAIKCSDIICELDSMSDYSGVDLVFGGPPCQAFSVAGKMDLDDPRAKLVETFMQVVAAVEPKMFIMENVKALAKLSKFGGVRQSLFKAALSNNYEVDLVTLNAKDFGVPQARERMFFVGIKNAKSFRFKDYINRYYQPEVSTKDALAHLGKQGSKNNPATCKAIITLAARPILRRSPYAGMLFNGAGRPINPNCPSPTLAASMGGNRTPIIDERQYYGDGNAWVEDYHVHLTDGGMPYDLNSAPPYLRRLTLNEAKVLHSFPSNFVFEGPPSSIYSQIGNAVPCLLSEVVVKALLDIVNGLLPNLDSKDTQDELPFSD